MAAKSKTVQKGIDTEEEANGVLLQQIALDDANITQLKLTLKALTENRDSLLQEAITKKIERAGGYKLVCKATARRSVDLEAVKTLLTTDQILEICTITLKEAEKYITGEQLEACTSKTISSSYKVIECYEPAGCGKQ